MKALPILFSLFIILVVLVVIATSFGILWELEKSAEREDFCEENGLYYRRKPCGFSCSEDQCFNETNVYEQVKVKGGFVLIPK